MIRIEPLCDITQLEPFLTAHALDEYKTVGSRIPQIIGLSWPRLLISENETPLFAAGLYRSSLVTKWPELWLLVTKHFTARHCREVFPLFHECREAYPRMRVTFSERNAPCERMAKFFGFNLVEASEHHALYEVS